MIAGSTSRRHVAVLRSRLRRSSAAAVAVGVAILRHRLYDIDLVINRTLVYGVLTAVLVATYLGSVLLLPGCCSSPLAGDSDLAVAASTLAVAALFRPLRAAIQAVVDRRFFRSPVRRRAHPRRVRRRLRHELDLEPLATDLRAVVHDTMQPDARLASGSGAAVTRLARP